MDFNNANGARPNGNLIQASDGKLYGMTSEGGGGKDGHGKNGLGVIFSFDPFNSKYTKLEDFDNTNGAFPAGSLLQATDGKLYGMTFQGGSTNKGVIFSYDPVAAAYTKLRDFDDADGSMPQGSFMQATDEMLYGMTKGGGSSGQGVIFSFDPSSSTYTKLQDFIGVNGSHPYIGSAFIEVNECIAVTKWYRDADGDGYGNPGVPLKACTQPAGNVSNNSDCDDTNAAIHAPVTFYRDKDRDGFGDANNSISLCKNIPPAGYVKNNYDCDDHDRAGHAWNTRVVMCRNGNQECVKIKEIYKKLHHGWILGPCTQLNCSPNETVLCHIGNAECVKTKNIQKKLCEPGHHWAMGDCSRGTAVSRTNIEAAIKAGIYNEEQSIPGQYKLSNYPNPFAGTSIIQYELPMDSKESIKVYDLLGRTVAILVDENKKAGA